MLDLTLLESTLREKIFAIVELVRAAGARAYLVGGSVRDLLLGARDVKDVDLEVFGLSAEKLQALLRPNFPFDVCGLSFGVIKLKSCPIDIALPRRESKAGRGHKDFFVSSDPTMSIADAALRRDFTINAIYFDPLANQIIDPFKGADDLRARVLRPVSAKFSEDPLRVLRAMQFIARFELTAADETIARCREMEMEGLASERLFEEWTKLLTKGIAISRGLNFLRNTNWIRYFPELSRLTGCAQDPQWHPEGDVWNHTMLALDAFARARLNDSREDLIVGLAVLCHDFGKFATTFTDARTGHMKSPGHDEAGVEPTLSFLRRLTNEERILAEVPALVRAHMQPYALWKSRAGDSAIRRLALRVGRVDRLIRVVQADEDGRDFAKNTGDDSTARALQWLAARAESLHVAAMKPKPILQGRHLIEFGLQPSPTFAKILAKSFEAQLDGAFADLDGARAYAQKYILPAFISRDFS